MRIVQICVIFVSSKNGYMNVEFEKEYLAELYEKGKTNDKKHRFQPQIVNGYLKCVKALLNASRMEDLYQYRSLNYEKLKGDKKGLLLYASMTNTDWNLRKSPMRVIKQS